MDKENWYRKTQRTKGKTASGGREPKERKHKVGGNTYGRTARPLGKII